MSCEEVEAAYRERIRTLHDCLCRIDSLAMHIVHEQNPARHHEFAEVIRERVREALHPAKADKGEQP